MNLSDADKAAAEIVEAITPFCSRIEIAGSIRRRVLFPGDIEIVAIPKNQTLLQLRDIVNNKWGAPSIGLFPSKYTRIRRSYNIDLFWPTTRNWGMIYFIRTGSAEFAKKALIRWKEITKGGYSEDGLLHTADHVVVETPEEADVFKALKWAYVPPEKRGNTF